MSYYYENKCNIWICQTFSAINAIRFIIYQNGAVPQLVMVQIISGFMELNLMGDRCIAM